jgi:hypothetical protein
MADEDQGVVPVSRERVETCLRSATFWVVALPKYADRQQRKADLWAIAAGVLAALTGLAIFPVLTDSSTDLEKVLVSLVAFVAAICALVPRVMNYAEFAGQARELSSRYGGVVGDLTDLAQAKSYDSEMARRVVEAFEAIKENKDALRGLPDRAAEEIARIESEMKVLEAQTRLDAARAAASGGKPGA